MSLAILQAPSSVGAPIDPTADWITLEQQLRQLTFPLSHPIAQAVSQVSKELIPQLADMIAQYALADPWLTDWHKAHSLLKSRVTTIPPLPKHIHQVMDSKCPIYGDQIQPDGTHLTVKDTHFLSLVLEEFGTLNRLERDILKPYGMKTYLNQENPLQFEDFWGLARDKYGDIPFLGTHWALITKDVLPDSRDKSWDEHVELVDALCRKSLLDYQIPNLQQIFAAITTQMVATGERYYQSGNQSGKVSTFTRVKETVSGHHVAVGGFSPSGVSIFYDCRGNSPRLGVAAVRIF